QHSGAGRAFIRHRPGFGHAVMVEYTCVIPKLAQTRPHCWHTSAWLTGDDEQLHAGFPQIDLLLSSGFRQPNAISRRAAENGRAGVENRPQPTTAAQSASGDTQTTEAGGGFEREPKPNEWAE